MEAIWFCTCSCAPCPRPTVAITAPTPMMMPSIVSSERILLRASALIAIRKIASKSIMTPVIQNIAKIAGIAKIANPGPYRSPTRTASVLINRRQRLEYICRPRPLLYRIVTPDLAIAEHHNPPGEFRDVRFVRHQHNRQSLVVERLENLHDLHRRPAVQVSRWFVSQQNRWAIHQCSRYCHALLLSTGKLGREVVQPLAQPHQL